MLKFPFNNEKPELAIIIPPAILNAVIVIPKKDKTYCPTKKDIIKIIKTLIHEYLHAWIVRNNKSKTLEFYNLSKVSNTESLWIYEGIVAYLEKKIMFDVGLISLKEYKSILIQNYSDVYNENGFKQSLRSFQKQFVDAITQNKRIRMNLGNVILQ